jgi:hypothetical protein
MKTIRTASQVREGINNKSFSLENGLTAVIATIPFSSRKEDLGIQFWNAEILAKGFSVNVDGSISRLVEIY